MILSEFVLRIRERCPLFERRVGGTASFSSIKFDDYDIALPGAWIMPIGDVAERPDGNASAQLITDRFAVLVCVSNDISRRHGEGFVASDAIIAVRQELWTALLNWEPIQWKNGTSLPDENTVEPWAAETVPNSRASKIRYVRGSHVNMNPYHLWHQFEFELDYYVNTHDVEPVDTPISKILYGFAPNVGDYGGTAGDYSEAFTWDAELTVYNIGGDTIPAADVKVSKFFSSTKPDGAPEEEEGIGT